MLKRALITGILGQDGIHLTKLLLSKNYEIFGLIKEGINTKLPNFKAMFPEVKILVGDLANTSMIFRVVDFISPHEIYNLGAISFIGSSFDKPEQSANINGLGPLRLLEAIRNLGAEKNVRFYQASSSEMYGSVLHSPQDENTNFHPRTPYGAAKVYAHQISVNYRELYGMHISCGILFNHESEFRGEEFVTRKISKGLSQIKKGKLDKIKLGNLESKRDWGYAGDYVEAMWLMLQQSIPDDYVVATGKAHSVRDFLISALSVAGLKGTPERYVILDDTLKRPAEVGLLVGDSSKARSILGWQPKMSFEQLIKRMVEYDLKI